MSRASWSKHRHWHDSRGRTHKQGRHVPELLSAALRYRPETQPAPEATFLCEWCRAQVPVSEPTCPSCGRETLPF